MELCKSPTLYVYTGTISFPKPICWKDRLFVEKFPLNGLDTLVKKHLTTHFFLPPFYFISLSSYQHCTVDYYSFAVKFWSKEVWVLSLASFFKIVLGIQGHPRSYMNFGVDFLQKPRLGFATDCMQSPGHIGLHWHPNSPSPSPRHFWLL
jgi:hypothetical protein